MAKDKKVYTKGRTDYGLLGAGENNKKVTYVDNLHEIENLRHKSISDVACGAYNSFALGKDGHLFVWGFGTNHQMGFGTSDDVCEPTILQSKQLKNKRILQVSSGGQHSLMILHEKSLKIKKKR